MKKDKGEGGGAHIYVEWELVRPCVHTAQMHFFFCARVEVYGHALVGKFLNLDHMRASASETISDHQNHAKFMATGL